MRKTVRPQTSNVAAHAEQADRAARLRDTAGRFAKTRDAGIAAPEPVAQEAPSRGTVPVSADAPDGTYALEVTGEGLGRHADPGAAIIVAPVMPTGAGLAVFYLKGKPGPVVFDLTHFFNPEFARPFKAGSEVVPLIEVVEPRTGRLGHISADRVEMIHRAIGIYSDADLPSKYGPRPPKLPLMSECPEGMGEHYADDAAAYPLVRKGETVVYDPRRCEPTHGALCVMQRSNGVRDVMLTNLRPVGGMGEDRWWVDPVNRVGDRTVFASDGPYDADHLREKIIGTVVGVLAPQSEAAVETVRPQPAEEVGQPWERERRAAAMTALDETGLTSVVSGEVRAAIVRLCDVMEATRFRGDETDKECNRDAALQIEAEGAVAHVSTVSLADLRAKLTCLLPLMADHMLDELHAEYLRTLRDDADRLCRQPLDRAAPDPDETDEEAQIRLAAIPFTPSDLQGPCPVPSNADWIRDATVTLPWLRHEFVMVCSSREQLTSFLRDQPEEEFADLIAGLGVAQRNLAQMARLAGEALERVTIGMAILAEEERLFDKGGKV